MELGLGLVITLIGMVIVFLTLMVLMYVVELPKFLLSLFSRKTETHLPTNNLPQSIPPHHIVAISAAITTLGLGRVNKISLISNEN